MWRRIFSLNFDQPDPGFNKKDGISAIGYYVFYLTAMMLFGAYLSIPGLSDLFRRYFESEALIKLLLYIPSVLLFLFPIWLMMRKRKHRLASIGLKNKHNMRSVLIGVIGSIPFVLLNISGPVSSGMRVNPHITENIFTFLYYLICIAFVEEVAFRGFIQTRIRGIIQNKWVGIVVAGLMFSLMHIPFQWLRSGMALPEFILSQLGHLLLLLVIHIYLVYLYTRNNNLLAPMIAHTLMDFGYAIFI